MSEPKYEKNIKFRYIRDKNRHPRGVVVVDTETEEFGWSYCCKCDQFTKDRARNIAVKRLSWGTNKKPPQVVQDEIVAALDWIRSKGDK